MDVYLSYYNGFLGQSTKNSSNFADYFVEFYNKTKVVNYCNDVSICLKNLQPELIVFILFIGKRL